MEACLSKRSVWGVATYGHSVRTILVSVVPRPNLVGGVRNEGPLI